MTPDTKKTGKEQGNLPTFFSSYWNNDFLKNFFDGGVPATNVKENDKQFIIDVSTPGMDKENIKVEVDKNVLKISAEKKTETEEKDENEKVLRHEFGYSSFSRSFTIPEGIDTDNISASQENGVLQIILPKEQDAKEDKVRSISID
ncbi:MAG: Hsp20/alpha crystallin family protein [Parabacteroides sp.]|nr:Hsp20/alpha crystallin family protein [Parabacteroides sp.]